MSLTSYRAAPPRVKAGGTGGEAPAYSGRAARASCCTGERLFSIRREGRQCEGGARDSAEAPPWRDGFRERELAVLGRPGNDLLSRVLRHSTIGAEEFNGRVRDGIGFGLLAQVTGPAKNSGKHWMVLCVFDERISNMRTIKPIELLVPVSSMRYRTCTPGLSTWSSSTALKGVLVLRWVSRLDAFSGYPVRT